MLIDTHCHINIMIKEKFDVFLNDSNIEMAKKITIEAENSKITKIINVGTSLIESINCITIAQKCKNNYAVVGIHPNDCSSTWQQDLKTIAKKTLVQNNINEKNKTKNKIVGIGECGLDYHYKNLNKQRQKDAFKAQIELSLETKLPLVIHTRDAADETLQCLEEFKNEQNLHGVFHCFSQDQSFANYVIKELKFFIGIGGIITYPKNDSLRLIIKNVGLKNILLETDAPYLPPQTIRGKQNHPKEIKTIANYLTNLLETDFESIAQQTTNNAEKLFNLKNF